MAKPLSILFVTSEIYPYAKETGIGDVAYSFSLAMREFMHDIRIMTPKYGNVSERKNKIHEINRLRDVPIPIGEESYPATIKSSSLSNPRNKVQAYITTNHKYFDSRKGIYHDVADWKLFDDNFDRFVYFCRSVVETCMILGWYPDIIHCNDWQTAIIPAYLKTLFPSKFKKTKTILTIHNLHGQPNIPLSDFAKTGLSKDVLPAFRHKNSINLIKGGMAYANYVTTVSPTYAKLLLSDKDYTNGLNTVFKENSSKFQGILNGIEPYAWNPAYDEFLTHRYENNLTDFKYNNKVELCNKAGFEYSPKKPLIGMIGKVDTSKGFDLMIESLPEILKKDIQMVILGRGDEAMQQQLEKIEAKYPEKLKYLSSFDEQVAHLIEAGSDIFLLPSVNEPCGLNLMYSLAYGTLPVVYNCGGYKETAVQFDKDTKKGNSILFNKHTMQDFIQAIDSAISLFEEKPVWNELIQNIFDGDYTWGDSAAKYDEIYRNIMKEQNS